MSMFGTIMSKIFNHGGAGVPPGASAAAPSAPAQTVAANTGAGAAASAPPAISSAPSPDTTGAMSTSTATPAVGGSAPSVDVAQVLDGLGQHAGQKLDWRHSIVDMLKLLDMDSSLSARKTLAHELNYTGDTEDSAAMNIWLHKEVMAKLAANGGKLPADLQA